MFTRKGNSVFVLLVVTLWPLLAQRATAQFIFDAQSKIEPALQQQRIRRDASEEIVVGIWLRQNYDPDVDTLAMLSAQSEDQRSVVRQRVQQKIAATQQSFVNWLAAQGLQVIYQSRFAPLVFASMPNQSLPSAAARSDVDRLYLSRTYELEMEHAEKSVRADVTWARGINGSGLAATWVGIVEFNRIDFSNPYLNHIGNTPVFRPAGATGPHVTSVAGVIAAATDGSAGNHGRYRGVAHGLNGLVNANAVSSADHDIVEAVEWAMDQNAAILNNSWGKDTQLAAVAMDRYYDYLVRNEFMTIVKSAGNNAGGYGTNTSNVTSPGLGYNVITVGSFRSFSNNRWNDDRMSVFSSFLPDPGTPAGMDREKPELVAVGEDESLQMHRLTDTGSVLSLQAGGTSFAAPAVTGACLLLAERDLSLLTYPEAMKAILMASACHNIEGDARLSSLDGAGGLVVCEADEVAANGQFHHEIVTASDFDPDGYWAHTINLEAGDGQGPPKFARVVLTWLADPSRQQVTGTSTALTANTLSDANAPFGAVNSKVGWFLKPDQNDPFTFRVTANTANILTVTGGDMTVNAAVGDTYDLFQHPVNQAAAITGTSTGLTASTLTDATSPFGAANSKVGWYVQPSLQTSWAYRVTANTASQLTVNVVHPNHDMQDEANVGDTYTLFPLAADPLDANLDLRIWDVTAGAYVAGADSMSVNNNFEISRFVPDNTGAYEIRVFDTTFNGTLEKIGLAWAQEPCCQPDWGDAPDDMMPCIVRPLRGDFPTRQNSVGASVREFEVEWLSSDNTTMPGASWEMDAWVPPNVAEKDEDMVSNINLFPICIPNVDFEDDGVSPDPIYFAGQKGEVTFWVSSATPDIGRYSSARADEKIYVRGWFDWEHDDASWDGNQEIVWVGGPTMVGQMLQGQTCIAGCDMWDPDDHQKMVTIDFTVPDFIPEGPFYLRFRASYGENDSISYTAPKTTYFGPATYRGRTSYGEVEDHLSFQAQKIEIDDFPVSEALVTLITPSGSEVVSLSGPATIEVDLAGLTDSDGNGREQVQTEIVEMNLTGTSDAIGPITVRVRPESSPPFIPTFGEIEEKDNLTPGILDLAPFTEEGAAASFFDVFFEIEAGPGILHNNEPKRMESQITHKPPAEGETYFNPDIIPLFDENDNPTGFSIGFASHTPVPLTCPEDIDRDGVVSITDLLILLADWGTCVNCADCPADLDPDCVVNILDLLILLASWGPCEVQPECISSADCDDGNACTGTEACVQGSCVPGVQLDCDDNDPCTDDACDTLKGCLHTPNSGPCDDGNACTVDDVCTATGCQGGPPADCDDGSPCTIETCVPDVGCVSSPDPTLCDDGNPCTDDLCDVESGCLNLPADGQSCDDGNPCTVGESCLAGECIGGLPNDCDDGDPCTDDFCDPSSGCINKPFSPCCGNGIIEPPEQCDPPDGVTCDDTCMLIGNPACTPDAGDCCQPHSMPGCNDPDCCNQVCNLQPFCCEIGWDEKCVQIAISDPACPCSEISDCCFPHDAPGCDDFLCQKLVCGNEPFCCQVQWDVICVDFALQLCDVCP